jgi:hypothetical protein
VHAKFGEGFFFLGLTRISQGKAGKYARGIILEKSKKNRRRIVEIFGECRPWPFIEGRRHSKGTYSKCFHGKAILSFPGKRECKFYFPGISGIPGIDFYLIKLEKGHFLRNIMQY